MPIAVQCDCGHEITVADSMAGRKGRCPKCDSVISIPAASGRRRRDRTLHTAPHAEPGRGYMHLTWLAGFLSVLAFLSLLLFAGLGTYTGVTAFSRPEAFSGPFGLFSEYADAVRNDRTLWGLAFILGGIVAGCVSFLFLGATGQLIRLFLSLERSLGDIGQHLSGRDRD